MKKRLVVLTGAGISAESGLKTFRDNDGLWMDHKIEDVATPRAFNKNPQLVLEFYNKRRSEISLAMPNQAHLALAKLEEKYHVTIITQNIDDLHERAGSTNVIHLHGEIFKMRCSKNPLLICEIRGDIFVGDLSAAGHQLRPHIVWFEEPVPLIEDAALLISETDLFLIVGTSLQVYPAAGLINYTKPSIPKYIIDKKIPPINSFEHLTAIEDDATSGMEKLLKILD